MAKVSQTVLVNGTDLWTYGLVWAERDGWRHATEGDVVSHELPAGEKALFQELQRNTPRRITLSGSIWADTMTGLRTRIDQLKAVLRTKGELQIAFPDDPDLHARGRVQSFSVGDYAPGALTPAAPYQLTFVCPDPRIHSDTETSVGAGVDCPLGTAKVRPIVEINGAATDPVTIELRDKDGVAVSSFTIAEALSAGQKFVVDAALGRVFKDVAGTETSKLAVFSGKLPLLDPETQADWLTSAWPKFVATAGAPASLVIRYNRAWE